MWIVSVFPQQVQEGFCTIPIVTFWSGATVLLTGLELVSSSSSWQVTWNLSESSKFVITSLWAVPDCSTAISWSIRIVAMANLKFIMAAIDCVYQQSHFALFDSTFMDNASYFSFGYSKYNLCMGVSWKCNHFLMRYPSSCLIIVMKVVTYMLMVVIYSVLTEIMIMIYNSIFFSFKKNLGFK